jgi:hypothetical protein
MDKIASSSSSSSSSSLMLATPDIEFTAGTVNSSAVFLTVGFTAGSRDSSFRNTNFFSTKTISSPTFTSISSSSPLDV